MSCWLTRSLSFFSNFKLLDGFLEKKDPMTPQQSDSCPVFFMTRSRFTVCYLRICPPPFSRQEPLVSGVSCKTVKCQWDILRPSFGVSPLSSPSFQIVNSILCFQNTAVRWLNCHDGVSCFGRSSCCSLYPVESRVMLFFSPFCQELQESAKRVSSCVTFLQIIDPGKQLESV